MCPPKMCASFYCLKGTIALSWSSTIECANCNRVYLIDTVVDMKGADEIFYAGEYETWV